MGPPNPIGTTAEQAAVVALRLDAETARDIHDALYAVGEHIAAGAPVESLGEAGERRVATVALIIRQAGDQIGDEG